MVTISYAITVKDELAEIQQLISLLSKYTSQNSKDEIVVLWDENGNPKILEYLKDIHYNGNVNLKLFKLKFDNNFAEWKNILNSFCLNEWVFFLDADELPSEDLLNNIHELLENNKEVELFLVPRINTVNSIGLSHINKWGWNVSKLESHFTEKEFDLENPRDQDEYNLLKKYNLIIEELYL